MATNSFLNELNIQLARFNDTDAAHDGDWVNLRNYSSLVCVVMGEDAAAGDDVEISVMQATSNTGGSEKSFSPRRYYLKESSDSGVGGSYAEHAPDADGNITIEGDDFNRLLFEIRADELDVANGFEYVQVNHDGGGSTNKFISITYILCGPRYAVPPDQYPDVT